MMGSKKIVDCQSLHVDLSKETLVGTQQLELKEMHNELRKDTVIVDHRANRGTFPNSSPFGPIAPPSRSTGQLAASVSRHGSPAQCCAITPPSSRTTSDSLHGNPAYYCAVTSPSLSSRSTEQSASVIPVHNIEHVTREGAPPWHDQT
ncbi:hypothetical protein LOK49_LG03G01575 [Camellia lanceoleosa]|uniref:Uncharacterized protein n=1 Tax=Camellia lanceoleosa TaxID=1840588 RepID=A0ACC0ICG2_9ERIC|nr:hypothetical protein LOK49_LG03G01575 [Camellia lanceoleosa]